MRLEHVDVLIVGAGLSGVGAGCHLETDCPGKSYAILEARGSIGGTWDLFRYPGVRSDSDMYTLGYSFRPWTDAKAIADGPAILTYVKETASDYGVEGKIRTGHRVVRAEWSSAEARWTVEAERTDTGQTVQLSCGFLFMCTGYYRYDAGYTPEFPGRERFAGQIVHPQFWTDDVDHAGKRVVVIGSGATAVTLVPAMAETAEHLTMLVFQLSRRRPRVMKALIRKGLENRLPPGYDIDTHFKPRYNPWDQRMCLVPDGDLFEAICDGRASVVTDTIETFTEAGLRLESGAELEADLVVTATGLDLLPLGGMELSVDGREVELPKTMGYKGMMLSGVPNMAVAIGYTNASWTLKCDLTCEYVCRLLNHMDEHGYRQATPQNNDPSVREEPFIDFTSGYVLRAIDRFPRQGSKAPWRLYQNYARDIVALRHGKLEDGALVFSSPERNAAPARDAAP